MRVSLSAAVAAVAAAAVASASAFKTSEPYEYAGCESQCRFKFCDYKQAFDVGVEADTPFTGAICDERGAVIGIVGETGEAYAVEDHGKKVKISHWHPHGLQQKFSPSFFKSFALPSHYHQSGIGHETPQQNQVDFLDRQCFTLPLKAYQVLERDDHGQWNVVDNVHTGHYDEKTECVAFQTLVPHKHL